MLNFLVHTNKSPLLWGGFRFRVAVGDHEAGLDATAKVIKDYGWASGQPPSASDRNASPLGIVATAL